RLKWVIREGEKVKVKRITFIGNRQISDFKLKDAMVTKEEGYFSGISGSGSYKQEAFDRDIQIVRLLYLNEGYVQVKVDRPQVFVSPDKKSIFVTIRVEEGLQYRVGEVDFSGDLLSTRQELFDSVEIDQREIFSYEVLQ
ncbi:MAG: outer membrane protein assembly factor BamA, partial [Bdellovibrionaceae bacterium]|nr:outer membrane protein assembly factor BamA [Pseudobdellovibrionaceae bacterium]